MKTINLKSLTFCLIMLFTSIVRADNTVQAVENQLRGNSNYNVVVAVLLLIFAGIIGYLFRLDRKINKIEKEMNK